MKNRTLSGIICLLAIAAPLRGEDSGPANALNDPFLDKLVGDWNVVRKFPNGRTAENRLHVEWVLQHQFIELHYRDAATPPRYEAMILIGYDGVAKRYICHWADSFGGDFSADGFATRNEASNAMEFKFEFHDGQLTNRFAFGAESGTWTSTIRQAEKGEWKLFCEDKFTRAARGDSK